MDDVKSDELHAREKPTRSKFFRPVPSTKGGFGASPYGSGGYGTPRTINRQEEEPEKT